jgi:hypothetical protein
MNFFELLGVMKCDLKKRAQEIQALFRGVV